MAYPASLIAFEFVKQGIIKDMPVSQMKLQKMVFFAHGYHLAVYGKPLIDEEFQAWKYGPVVPSIYETYKLYGSDDITDISLIRRTEVADFATTPLSDSANEAIGYTWEATGNLTAFQLSRWTHRDDSPWTLTYKPDLPSAPIKNKEISEYFNHFLLVKK